MGEIITDSSQFNSQEENSNLESSAQPEQSIDDETKKRIDADLRELTERYSDIPSLRAVFQEILIKEGRTQEQYDEAYNEAELWVSDIEYLSRHAYAVGAENIIFLDKGARADGALAKEILSILKLEYCKVNDISPDLVKKPNVIFINPADHAYLRDENELVKDYSSKLSGTNNIVSDEASMRYTDDRILHRYISKELNPENQYLFTKILHDTAIEVSEKTGHIGGKEAMEAVSLLKERLNPLFPDSEKRLLSDSALLGLIISRRTDMGQESERWKSDEFPSACYLSGQLSRLMPTASFETHVGSEEIHGGHGGGVSSYINKERIKNSSSPMYVTDPKDDSNYSERDPNTTHDDIREGFRIVKSVAKISFDKLMTRFF